MPPKKTRVTFESHDGKERLEVVGKVGQTLLELAWANEIDMEGACEASLSCSTCHVIVAEDYFKRLPAASEEEEDMLDLAFGLTMTSRLGCQIVLSDELDGLVVRLPAETRNMM